MLLMWGGNCKEQQLRDTKGTTTRGDCRRQAGWKLMQRAPQLLATVSRSAQALRLHFLSLRHSVVRLMPR